MAPTKPKVDPKPKASKQKVTKQKTTNKSDNRVAKRPARGFHRFRNGVMNVTPKGGEKELVKNNQNSPLLRLPAELRRQIWEHALGYKLMVMSPNPGHGRHAPRVVAPHAERDHGTDLLRTCRQIYSEAVLLSLSLNTFTFYHFNYPSIMDCMKAMRPYQRRAITQLQLHIHPFYSAGIPTQKLESRYNLDFLPGLKTVSVVVVNPENDPRGEDMRKIVESQLGIFLAGRNVEVVFENTHLKWANYVAGWKYSAH